MGTRGQCDHLWQRGAGIAIAVPNQAEDGDDPGNHNARQDRHQQPQEPQLGWFGQIFACVIALGGVHDQPIYHHFGQSAVAS